MAQSSVSYTVSEDQYIRAVFADCLVKNLRVLIAVAALCLLAAILVPEARLVAGCGLVGGMVGGGVQLLIIRRRTRAIYREQRTAGETRTLTLYDDHAEIVSTSGSYRPLWTDILKWQEASGVLRLYISRAMFLPMPLDQLGAAADEVRRHLRASGLVQPGKKRRRA